MPHPTHVTETGYVYHPLFVWHDTRTHTGLIPPHPVAGVQPGAHYEHPDTKRRTHELLEVSGLLDHLVRITPRPATELEVGRVHTRRHIEHIRSQSLRAEGGDAGDGYSPLGHGSYDIALLAAGGLIELVDAIARDEITSGYALIRPPGHHATADAGMGFCLFNNIAIAIQHLRATTGLRRIAVVDIDVHHGNGTQAIFYDTPDVLTISLHQANCFPPNSGWTAENGSGTGAGYAINVPLPPGTGVHGYRYAMDQVVLPALNRYHPDLILVSCGFDAAVLDPLGRQMLTAAAYGDITRQLQDAADRLCGGRIALAHEGGYSPDYVPFCALATLEALTGTSTGIADPLAHIVAGWANEPLLPHQKAVVDEAARLVERVRTATPAAT